MKTGPQGKPQEGFARPEKLGGSFRNARFVQHLNALWGYNRTSGCATDRFEDTDPPVRIDRRRAHSGPVILIGVYAQKGKRGVTPEKAVDTDGWGGY